MMNPQIISIQTKRLSLVVNIFHMGMFLVKKGDNILKNIVGLPEVIFKSSITFKYIELFSVEFAPENFGPSVGCDSSCSFVIIIYFIELVPYLSAVKNIRL